MFPLFGDMTSAGLMIVVILASRIMQILACFIFTFVFIAFRYFWKYLNRNFLDFGTYFS